MAFIETPRFPVDVNYGTMGGPMYSTDIVTYGNGGEYRNANWSLPLYQYDARYAIKSRTQLVNVYEFFIALKGMADGFRAKDLFDFTSASNGKDSRAIDDQTIGTGDNSETDFQLIKTYTKGSQSVSRNILKPVSGTVLVEVDSVAQTEGVDFTVDTTTGIVTFTTPPGSGLVIKAGFEFDVPVRFGKDDMSDLTLAVYSSNSNGDTDFGSIESLPLIELRNP